jgi:hypothetical protein
VIGGDQLIETLSGGTVGLDLGVDFADDVGDGRCLSVVEAVEVGHAEVVAAVAELVDVAGGEGDVGGGGGGVGVPAKGVEDGEGVAVDDRERLLGFGPKSRRSSK